MNDAFCVRRIQSIGNLNGHVEQFVGLDGTARDALPERLAFEQFHGDEGLTFGLVDVVDGADVGMIQCRSRLCLASEALQSVFVLG